ncbi:MAG: hypothetical protein WC978_02380 [bacterium]
MATDNVLNTLKGHIDVIEKVDIDKLMRMNLGDESLEVQFRPRLERIQQLIDFSKRYAPTVHDEFINNMNTIIQNIGTKMNEQAARPPSEFIAQRQGFLTNIDAYLEQSRRWFPYFVASAVVERGFLADESIKQEYDAPARSHAAR